MDAFAVPADCDCKARAEIAQREPDASARRIPPVKYAIDFQFLPKGAKTPEDIGGVEDVELDEENFGLVPFVGDYVDIPGDRDGNREHFRGKVCRRTFRYVLGYCHVKVVIAETDAQTWAEIDT